MQRTSRTPAARSTTIASTSARRRAIRRRSSSPEAAIVSPCWSMAATRSSTPSPVSAMVVSTGGDQPARLAHGGRVPSGRGRPWRRRAGPALLTTKMSAISRMPALMIWNGIAGRRRGDHHGGVGGLHDLELGLADADRLEQASIPAGGRRGGVSPRGRRGKSSEMAASRHAANEDTRSRCGGPSGPGRRGSLRR